MTDINCIFNFFNNVLILWSIGRIFDMNYITITSEKNETYSSISNFFIDYYMTSANGDFVKVYLYLVRLMSSREPVSIADIANHFDLSEKFICKAIRYWISQDVMKLNYNSQKVLTGITLLPLRDKSEDMYGLDSLSMLGMDYSVDTPDIHDTVHDTEDTHGTDMAAASRMTQEDIFTAAAQTSPKAQQNISVPDAVPVHNVSAVHNPPDKVLITPELLRKKQEDDIFSDILFEAEAFYGKTLSMAESETLIYIYDQLHFSQELIEYLIEYCLTLGKKSFKYAEAVAKAWYENGIDTVEKARENSNAYNPLFRKVFRELGISRNRPTSAETAYIDAWSDEMGFSEDLITFACQKAILSRPQSANFAYVNGILENWYKNGVKSIRDVETLDQEFIKKKNENTGHTYNTAAKPNSFANFQQTDMSDQLAALEQMLADDLNQDKKTS